MNRKSIEGTVLAGGKKEILSLLSIDSSFLYYSLEDSEIENQRRVAKTRKRQVGGMRGGERSYWRVARTWCREGAGSWQPQRSWLVDGDSGGCSWVSFLGPL